MSKISTSKNRTKRETITQQAAVLFRRKGYASSTMRELAEEIGVEASSLYNHIGSKVEMLKEICFKVAEAFHSHLDETEKNLTSPTQKIESLIRFHIHMMLDDFDAVYVSNHEWNQLKEPELSSFLQLRRNYEKRMTDIVMKGIEEKQFSPGNASVIVFTILSALRGLELWQRHKKNISKIELENTMLQQLLHGILKNR
ncbi:MAG: hypothetical protein RL582_1635 [Bacteroidota bacterium]|jgi:AcrR family transcriptional regulator